MKIGIAGLALLLTGCTAGQSGLLGATIIATAHGVKAADDICAYYAEHKSDVKTAQKCAESYRVARGALLTAESALRSAQFASEQDVACAVASALRAVKSTVDVISALGGNVPEFATQALSLSVVVEGMCGK